MPVEGPPLDWIDARPAWRAVRSAADALELRRHQLLHAGPPLRDPRQPPQTLRSSIVMTCLHEGWAADPVAAEALLQDGALQLQPAQDHGCVTPLASVVSAGTPLFEVADARDSSSSVYAPVSAVCGADTRMGCRDPLLLQRLQRRDTVVAPMLQHWVARHGPLDLWTVAAQGLAAGDDLHATTAQANGAFGAALRTKLRSGDDTGAVVDDIEATPLFFLTLWMAACASILQVAAHSGASTVVTRAGGTGERFGIALGRNRQRWITCEAAPPTGPHLPSAPVDVSVEGAIGDSAVIDMLGLGGQRLARAPTLLTVFADHPAAGASLQAAPPERLLSRAHPLLPDGWPLGLDATRVVQLQQAPRVMLGMIGRDGRTGLCGRGLYRPPVSLFEAALREPD